MATREGKREDVWKVRWERAELEYAGEGSFGGTMHGVSGTIYEGGVEVSDFSAQRAQADKESNLLRLSGQVRVVARESQSVLTCDTLDWLDVTEMLQAQGNVTLETPAYQVGRFPVIWAAPELEEYGTPDRFAPQREQMKTYQAVVAALATVSAVGGASGGQSQITFRDKAGTMQLSNFTSWKSSGQDVIKFSGSGNPLRYTWTTQNLTGQSATFEGTARRSEQRTELVEAIVGGGVRSTATRPSSAGGNATQTIVLNSQTARYTAENSRITLTGGVTVNQEDAAADQRMTMTGAQGTIDLVPPGAKAMRPVRAAVLAGPVRVEIKGSRRTTVTEGGQSRT
ncbi:MAG TPA: hypothetical protein VM328_04420, partial [Fimbriimonadaceae bacterium]|nr:hypothetical protein [Fimbriimonadaceae bacterium]